MILLVKFVNLGVILVIVDLVMLCNYIDWMLFFLIWFLVGKYLCIFEDEVVGEQVQLLFNDVNVMLDKIIEENSFQVKGVIGLFFVNCVNDDVEIYIDELRNQI